MGDKSHWKQCPVPVSYLKCRPRTSPARSPEEPGGRAGRGRQRDGEANGESAAPGPWREEPGPLPPPPTAGHFCPASWSERPGLAISHPSCKDQDLTLPVALPPPSPLRECPLPLLQVPTWFSAREGMRILRRWRRSPPGPAPPSPSPGDGHCASTGESAMGDTRETIGGRLEHLTERTAHLTTPRRVLPWFSQGFVCQTSWCWEGRDGTPSGAQP